VKGMKNLLEGKFKMKKEKLYFPDYKKSIINLMASIENALGGKSKYAPLKEIDSKKLGKSKNVVLIVLDGLGYEFLMKYGEKSFFNENLKAKLTSAFPAGTTSLIPTLLTGCPAEEHGMVSWYSFIKEIGTVIIPLMFVPRVMKKELDKDVNINKLFNIRPFANRIKRKAYVINPKRFSHGSFNLVSSGKAKIIAYNDEKVHDFFTKIKSTIKKDKQKKYIYAYYPNPDSLIHKYGETHKKVLANFRKLNKEIKSFVKSIENTNTTLIITADHGLYDIKKSNRLIVQKHPKFYECLTLPICGEGRIGFAYVKPFKTKQFEKYCNTKLKKYLYLYKSKDFVKKIRLRKPSKQFLDRIGDYVLVMKEPYIINDYLINSEPSENLGSHGGFSKEEMFVPLIVVEVK